MKESAAEVLIDSNVYIHLMRSGRDPAQAIFHRYDDLDVVTCGMIQLEVLRGVKLPKAKQALEETFSLMQFIPTDNRIWKKALELGWSLDRQGWTIPAQDLLIAASALRINAFVHTYDQHFSRIPGLNIVTDPL